jgi:hypothetical protein
MVVEWSEVASWAASPDSSTGLVRLGLLLLRLLTSVETGVGKHRRRHGVEQGLDVLGLGGVRVEPVIENLRWGHQR